MFPRIKKLELDNVAKFRNQNVNNMERISEEALLKISHNKKLILFDGICNFCDKTVQFIIKYDKKDTYRFISLQSNTGQYIIQSVGMDPQKIDSITLYCSKTEYYIKSTAVLKILESFGGWFILLKFLIIVPKSLQNLLYDYVAHNRYIWFGKNSSCIIPRSHIIKKFIIDEVD